MSLLSIFLVFFYFGLMCLSGGSSLLPFYIDELVESRHWLTLEELGNFMAISQITPGPIGVNLSTFLGWREGGFFGGLAGTVGLLLPSLLLMSLAIKSYEKWSNSKLVRSLMFGVKPITVSLVTGALFACIGMSILSEPLPFEALTFGLWGDPVSPDTISWPAIHWEMLPILALSMYLLGKKKCSIMAVIFLSAAAGSVLFALFGN